MIRLHHHTHTKRTPLANTVAAMSTDADKSISPHAIRLHKPLITRVAFVCVCLALIGAVPQCYAGETNSTTTTALPAIANSSTLPQEFAASAAPITDTINTTQSPPPPPLPPLPPSTPAERTSTVLLHLAEPSAAPSSTLETTTTTSAPTPDTCAGSAPLPVQPIVTDLARITFCKRALSHHNESNTTAPLTPNVALVHALFYEGCIEDTENATRLPPMWSDPCDGGGQLRFVYGADDADEQLYVLQNGSLLCTSQNQTVFDVFDTYCLYERPDDGRWLAEVCYDRMVSVSRAQAYLYAICMLVSVPCLLVTAYFYLAIPQLRNLHGKSLACHSLCLALGFLLLSIVQIRGTISPKTGYFIQYFLLACFMWLAVMCVDICTQVWYFIPRGITITPRMRSGRFYFYAAIAQGVPLVLVLLTIHYQLSGMPSYFLKGVTVATRWSQQFFIPPISTILFGCFLLLVVAYFGFRELNPLMRMVFLRNKQQEQQVHDEKSVVKLDVDLFEKTKQIARSTTYLYIIMTINWLFEITSFYVSSTTSVELFDILNALQGIVIFIIFVSLPRPLHIIKHWWTDRGELNTTEMEELRPVPVVVVEVPLNGDEEDPRLNVKEEDEKAALRSEKEAAW